jgi:phage terminase Nu1 subunit (DNA packaging protein)
MTDRPANPADPALTTNQLADLFGVTAARVRQLGAEKVAIPAGRNRWRAYASTRAYVALLKRAESPVADRIAGAKAELAELRVIEQTGALVAAARAEGLALVEEIVGGLVAALNAAPARITADPTQRRKIETELDAIRRTLAARIAAAAAKAETDTGRER